MNSHFPASQKSNYSSLARRQFICRLSLQCRHTHAHGSAWWMVMNPWFPSIFLSQSMGFGIVFPFPSVERYCTADGSSVTSHFIQFSLHQHLANWCTGFMMLLWSTYLWFLWLNLFSTLSSIHDARFAGSYLPYPVCCRSPYTLLRGLITPNFLCFASSRSFTSFQFAETGRNLFLSKPDAAGTVPGPGCRCPPPGTFRAGAATAGTEGRK